MSIWRMALFALARGMAFTPGGRVGVGAGGVTPFKGGLFGGPGKLVRKRVAASLRSRLNNSVARVSAKPSPTTTAREEVNMVTPLSYNCQADAGVRRSPPTERVGATAGGGGYRLWREPRIMPSFFIHLRRVFGSSPRIRAVLRGTSTTPSVCRRKVTM